MTCRGLLSDINVQGHMPYLQRVLDSLGLWAVLTELNLSFATFPDIGLPRNLSDRALWERCQKDGWVLFTENRNREDNDSLEATLADSWRAGHLPVLTLAQKGTFEHDVSYAKRVAGDIAELLFGIVQNEYCDQPRIYVPR